MLQLFRVGSAKQIGLDRRLDVRAMLPKRASDS